ncbi:type IV pilus biogenesis/stability protein PilW [Paludibacterium purpuratum]|uniref:type IV pilus biogenesis/stability protein PilW n=1 Tax=Paludibacterium purpuratum TaxID=1144873 RepID=UPI001414EC36|nr:type IV pilus biogenesis/stability protein PilW [Paludibacterium purpuratum]
MAILPAATFATAPLHELASLHVQLAFEYAKANQPGFALDAANRAVQVGEDFAPAWLARAHVHAMLSRDNEAERDYRQALTLAPENGEANNNFGLFLCRRGRLDDGARHLRRALVDPRYTSRETAYLNLGRCSLMADQAQQAIDHWLSALRAKPAYAPALRQLAALYTKQGSVELASYYFGRLIEHAGPLEAEDLLLGVGLARLSGDRVREEAYVGELRARFPDSRETQQLLSGI